MQTINIHKAKTHLSRLVDLAANGEPFVIAKAGKPLVKVVPIEQASVKSTRIGFMQDEIEIPDNFDTLGRKEIEQLFNGDTK
jgi:prevent-host-death family protein